MPSGRGSSRNLSPRGGSQPGSACRRAFKCAGRAFSPNSSRFVGFGVRCGSRFPLCKSLLHQCRPDRGPTARTGRYLPCFDLCHARPFVDPPLPASGPPRGPGSLPIWLVGRSPPSTILQRALSLCYGPLVASSLPPPRCAPSALSRLARSSNPATTRIMNPRRRLARTPAQPHCLTRDAART